MNVHNSYFNQQSLNLYNESTKLPILSFSAQFHYDRNLNDLKNNNQLRLSDSATSSNSAFSAANNGSNLFDSSVTSSSDHFSNQSLNQVVSCSSPKMSSAINNQQSQSSLFMENGSLASSVFDYSCQKNPLQHNTSTSSMSPLSLLSNNWDSLKNRKSICPSASPKSSVNQINETRTFLNRSKRTNQKVSKQRKSSRITENQKFANQFNFFEAFDKVDCELFKYTSKQIKKADEILKADFYLIKIPNMNPMVFSAKDTQAIIDQYAYLKQSEIEFPDWSKESQLAGSFIHYSNEALHNFGQSVLNSAPPINDVNYSPNIELPNRFQLPQNLQEQHIISPQNCLIPFQMQSFVEKSSSLFSGVPFNQTNILINQLNYPLLSTMIYPPSPYNMPNSDQFLSCANESACKQFTSNTPFYSPPQCEILGITQESLDQPKHFDSIQQNPCQALIDIRKNEQCVEKKLSIDKNENFNILTLNQPVSSNLKSKIPNEENIKIEVDLNNSKSIVNINRDMKLKNSQLSISRLKKSGKELLKKDVFDQAKPQDFPVKSQTVAKTSKKLLISIKKSMIGDISTCNYYPKKETEVKKKIMVSIKHTIYDNIDELMPFNLSQNLKGMTMAEDDDDLAKAIRSIL